MKILITGSEGTLGRPLRAELEKRGHEVWGLDLQHSDSKNYRRADVGNFRQMEWIGYSSFDYVYHMAAEFGRLNGEEFYDTLWKTNVIGTRNLLEVQRLNKKTKLIFASSSEIYGNLTLSLSGGIPEWASEHCNIRPLNDYALSKWASEQQIMNFEKRYESKAVRLRFFNAYGPGERYHDYRSVVCLFCYRALHGLPWDVYEGYSRVFMFIDDFTPTLANVVDNFKAGEVYNIGGSEYRSVRELSDLILKETGADPKLVTYLPEDKHNVTSKRPDCTKARLDFGHAPKVGLEEGIPKTLAWMREFYGK